MCLETRWLGQKPWFLLPGTLLYSLCVMTLSHWVKHDTDLEIQGERGKQREEKSRKSTLKGRKRAKRATARFICGLNMSIRITIVTNLLVSTGSPGMDIQQKLGSRCLASYKPTFIIVNSVQDVPTSNFFALPHKNQCLKCRKVVFLRCKTDECVSRPSACQHRSSARELCLTKSDSLWYTC